MSVHEFIKPPGSPVKLPPGGEPPNMAGMEARIAKLEVMAEKNSERLSAIDLKLAKIETQLDYKATKADVSDAKSSIIMWVVGTILLAQLFPALLKKFGL